MQANQLRMLSAGVELAVYRFGNPQGTPLLLVHGYPDNHHVWLPLIEQLAGEFQIFAYDVRGFGNSDKPLHRRDYQLPQLGRDLEAVLRAVSPERPVHLIGHDWGSIQSWETVTEPQCAPLLASFSSISGPCLDHVGFWLRARVKENSLSGYLSVARQLLSSWYIALFHLPWLPELCWRLGLANAWPQLLRRLEGVRMARNPAQLADGCHGIALYRANFIRSLFKPRKRSTSVPVQLIVPSRDRFVNPQLFDDLTDWAPKLQRHEVDAGHWQLLAEPAQLADFIRAFVQQQEALRQPQGAEAA